MIIDARRSPVRRPGQRGRRGARGSAGGFLHAATPSSSPPSARPVGKAPNGALRDTRPDELAATVIARSAARARPALDPAEIDDVILGCAMPEAEQGLNVARIASLRAGVPVTASAVTVNRFCSSGPAGDRLRRRAHHAAARADAIVAGGTESMSMVPMGGNKIAPNPALVDSYPDVYLTTGLVAENHARESSISREEQDAFALRSHQRAIAAIDAGPLRGRDRAGRRSRVVDAGNGGRPSIARRARSTPTKARAATRRSRRSAKLRPAFHASGTVTAGNSSQTSDGAAAVVVTSASARASCGLTPLGRFVALRHRRRRAGALRHRPGAGDPQGAEAGRPDARPDRSRRAERSVRRAGARLPARAADRSRTGSTSTAARSRSAIRSAAPARS